MRNFTKSLLALALLFVCLGVKAETREFKTPIKLTGATNSPTIEPIAPSTLEDLYAATFTPTADFSNIFQYKNLDVRDYEKIVIKFGSPVSGNWQMNYPDGNFLQIPANSTELVIDVSSYGTYGDFTIFNWAGERTPITISEAYFLNTYEVINSTDYSTVDAYSYWHGSLPTGGALEIDDVNDALKVYNPSALDGNWRFQYIVADNITTATDEDYLVTITLKSTVAGNVTCVFGGWNSKDQNKEFSVEVGNEWVTKEVKFSAFPYTLPNALTEDGAAHVLLQSGNLAGTILIQKVEVFKIPELNPIPKPDRTATDAKTDVFAGFKTIDGDATWDAETRFFTKTCGWQWDGEGIDLSQYRYLVITAGRNANTDGAAGLVWDYGRVTIKDNNNVTITGDDYGAPYMNLWFSQWNNHNCLKIDLEKLRKEKYFDIYHIKELTIKGDVGFILGNAYASNQAPENNKNWGAEDNGDFKVENLPADKFGTICLPYQAAVAGAFVYEITGKTANSISLAQCNDLMVAGKPYFFKTNASLKEATTGTADTKNVYFYKATAATVADPVANNGLIGTFTDTKAPLDSYILSSNKLYKVDAANTVTVGANKAYVDLDQVVTVLAREGISLDFNEPTGIKQVSVDAQGDGEFYNLAGQRVAQPAKGMYIVNGKKVIIK